MIIIKASLARKEQSILSSRKQAGSTKQIATTISGETSRITKAVTK